MVGLPDGKKNFEDMYNRLDSILACDRRTDRPTSCDGIVRAMHTRRAVKMGYYEFSTGIYVGSVLRLSRRVSVIEADVRAVVTQHQ